MPLSPEARQSQKRAFDRACEQAESTAIAKAEIAIEVILKRLAKDTCRSVKRVEVDTENHATPTVSIWL